jgi:hypothetical protein
MHKCIKHNEVASYKAAQQYIASSIPLGALMLKYPMSYNS